MNFDVSNIKMLWQLTNQALNIISLLHLANCNNFNYRLIFQHKKE
jgi:hypothetical protein